MIRAVDDGIVHVFHEKVCDPKLTEIQYRDCLGSLMDWEGTKTDLGRKIANYRIEIKELQRKKSAIAQTSVA